MAIRMATPIEVTLINAIGCRERLQVLKVRRIADILEITVQAGSVFPERTPPEIDLDSYYPE